MISVLVSLFYLGVKFESTEETRAGNENKEQRMTEYRTQEEDALPDQPILIKINAEWVDTGNKNINTEVKLK